MKLLVDMFACQTGSRFRGIGRYTLSLAREMARLRGKNEMAILANAIYPESFEYLRQEFTHLLPLGSFNPYYHPRKSECGHDLELHVVVSEALVRQAYEAVSPGIALYPSLFEGWYEDGVVPIPEGTFPSSKRVAVVYDFIPYVFADRYLDNNPDYKTWYLRKMNSYKNFDLLLAISESTRLDAINILNFNPEKVVNISAAASVDFKKTHYTHDQKLAILKRLKISRPFILYNGNEEYHKNFNMALQSFAQLPGELRESYQLVLTHSGDVTALRLKAQNLGLKAEELVITGHVSDDELVALYNFCKLLIFPSLYEGFGLPVLEAMACGAPVLASNNSSLPEVVGRSDALFDASDVHSIIATLTHALSDDHFLKDLSRYGIERSKLFSWEKTAQAAWDAILALEEKTSKHYIIPDTSSPRMRIAYVSPLPPQKSGIANYSAELLPHLLKYFDIDLFIDPDLKVSDEYLVNNFKFYSWKELPERYDTYGACVYQVGNSEFHAYMINLIRNYPGVVVQHDFFLSNIPFVQEYHKNEPGYFFKEIDYCHGLSGLVDYIKSGIDETRKQWPANWEVLRYAQELIVHSEYFNFLLDSFYKSGWRPRPNVVKQIRKEVELLNDAQKEIIRSELNIDPDVFLFCSFGMIAPTKLNHLIIQAFSLFLSQGKKKAFLCFVGELHKGDYGQEIVNLIKQLKLEKYVHFTDYVSPQAYEKYLNVADVAIQLRSNSRGETSRAVLDCMAFGVPVIINSHGSLNDYEDGDLVKLPDHFDSSELSTAMTRLYDDKGLRADITHNGRKTIAKFHDPEKVASDYAETIIKASKTREKVLFNPIIDTLITRSDNPEILQVIARNAAKNFNLRSQGRILMDVTDIYQRDHQGGIQRVVKSWIRELFSNRDLSFQLELVKLNEGQLVRSCRFTEVLFQLPVNSLGEEVPISPHPGDTLFMLDASWSYYEQFLPVYQSVRGMGGKIITMVYDLIPIRYPKTCHQVVLDVFENWLDTAILQSDQMICISKAVADDLAAYIDEKPIKLNHKLDLSYVHLGSDIQVVSYETPKRDLVQSIVKQDTSPLFIMVGTLEPRKGYAFVLDAFDVLWQKGRNYRLCILGKIGWNMKETMERIQTHNELFSRLFFVENASDAELNLCYSRATALISASLMEGFGLPIVEAAYYNIPVIASDIPVFREVGGDAAYYFSLKSVESLVEMVDIVVNITPEERLSTSAKIKILTWQESARNLEKVIRGENIYKVL